MDNDEIASTLNDLIEICKDGEKGFHDCAEGVRSQYLKSAFALAAGRCAQAASELSEKVRSYGAETSKGGTVSGSLHRAWVDIKSRIGGMDEVAVLTECERGEDVAKKAYEKALEKDLPLEIRAIVERQYHGVRENHDRVRDFRNAAAGKAA